MKPGPPGVGRLPKGLSVALSNARLPVMRGASYVPGASGWSGQGGLGSRGLVMIRGAYGKSVLKLRVISCVPTVLLVSPGSVKAGRMVHWYQEPVGKTPA
jgi:hypothetical protein